MIRDHLRLHEAADLIDVELPIRALAQLHDLDTGGDLGGLDRHAVVEARGEFRERAHVDGEAMPLNDPLPQSDPAGERFGDVVPGVVARIAEHRLALHFVNPALRELVEHGVDAAERFRLVGDGGEGAEAVAVHCPSPLAMSSRNTAAMKADSMAGRKSVV